MVTALLEVGPEVSRVFCVDRTENVSRRETLKATDQRRAISLRMAMPSWAARGVG